MEDMVSPAVNAAFWKDRRVFLTGHTGFKGSWLLLWLEKMGAEVTGYSLAAPSNGLFNLIQAGKPGAFVAQDVRDLKELRDSMEAARPEVVIHMAAQSLVRASYSDPIDTYSTNLMGTVNVLEAVRHCESIKAAVVVTTDKCYENREWPWGYRETDRLGGHDPYSSSKACAEMACAAYRSSFFNISRKLGIATARAGNVIGGGDSSQDRLVPDLLTAFSQGISTGIRNPDAIRPWQHVLEPLAGYLGLVERLVGSPAEFSEAWNFGPSDEDTQPVRWVADQLGNLYGNEARWHAEGASESRPHEAGILRLDCSKTRTRLSWRPQWTLDTALDKIVQWQHAFEAGEDMRQVTSRQIDEYCNARGIGSR
ncbi:MAG: CDP-glucose 4,6-dehydratase [Pseudomonadota bacterium]